MKTLIEAQTKVKKQEVTLNQLVKSHAEETVIAAQKEAVKNAKEELEMIENTPVVKAIRTEATRDFMTFNVVTETGTKQESKKMAFVKHNRPIDVKRVDKFIHLIHNGKYENAYPVIVADAQEITNNGYTVVDVNGNEINDTNTSDYYVILDGQHRCMAFAKLNAIGESHEIPNVYIRNKENIGEYLVEINDAAKSWDNKDKFTVAGLISKNEIFETIADAIKEGINPSTAAKIYIRKSIPNKTLNKVLSGEEFELPKDMKFNKKRGDRFITLCKAAKMPISLITKRYFIDGFNSYASSTTEENAFHALSQLGNLTDKDKELKKVKEGDDFIELLKKVA